MWAIERFDRGHGMVKEKYAIRFPEIQVSEFPESVSIFSEKGLEQTKRTFSQNFNLFQSLTNYVIQSNYTRELEKRINAKKEIIDDQVHQYQQQKQIEYEEYSKRLQEHLKTEKEKIELDFQRLSEETQTMVCQFSISSEEALRKSKIWLSIIQQEQDFLQITQKYTEVLKGDFSRRREYVLYCDAQRRSLVLIDKYLKEMI